MSLPKPGNQRGPGEFRVTRSKKVEAAHGDSHGWAVSYADLLMVLLSFFVLYFSFAEENPNTVHEKMQRMALAMKGLPQDALPGRKPQAEDLADLEKYLKIDGVTVTQVDDKLVLDLEKSVFRPADFVMSPSVRTQVDAVMAKLMPLKEGLALTVIGHADALGLRPRNEFLQDNFDLSSLRALRALKYVLGKGFPETHASARAASHFDRNTRSISFEIAMAKVKDTAGVVK